MPRKTRKHSGRPTLLSRVATRDIVGELQRRRSDFESQRQLLDAQIAELDALSAAPTAAARAKPSPAPAARRRGRGGNKQSLPTLLHSLLQGKTMSVGELAEAAQRGGYKSKSKNFRMLVSLALLSNRNLFKRVARGQYTAK